MSQVAQLASQELHYPFNELAKVAAGHVDTHELPERNVEDGQARQLIASPPLHLEQDELQDWHVWSLA